MFHDDTKQSSGKPSSTHAVPLPDPTTACTITTTTPTTTTGSTSRPFHLYDATDPITALFIPTAIVDLNRLKTDNTNNEQSPSTQVCFRLVFFLSFKLSIEQFE